MKARKKSVKKPAIVEIFAGIAGVAQGFAGSGLFEMSLLTDKDPDAARAFVHNFPDLEGKYLVGDISGVTSKKIRRRVGRQIAGIVGCPPCQGLSDAGKRRHVDTRNYLVDHFFRLLFELRPSFFVMENVPRLLTYSRFQQQIRSASAGYAIWQGVLNAAYYGVPQTRQRAVIIGYRNDLNTLPMPPVPTHCGKKKVFAYNLQRLVSPRSKNRGDAAGRYPLVDPRFLHEDGLRDATNDLVPCGDALTDLPPPNAGEVSYRRAARTPYQRRMRAGSQLVHNHHPWLHQPALLKRVETIPPGGSLMSTTGRAEHPYFSQAYGRLHAAALARTITTNFHNAGSGRFLHFAENRTLTVREAARLQSFPDSFILPDELDRTTQERLIGNAFPILLAEAIARQIHAQIGGLLSDVE
jgi:DNA (cytosine-5)-methyltransferase 1